MRSRTVAIIWLQVVRAAVLISSFLLDFAGAVAGTMFSWFGFGPSESINTEEVRDYLRLPYMVLGAVVAGWVILVIQIVRGPLRVGSPWAWTVLVRSPILWFVLDTGVSLVIGYPTLRRGRVTSSPPQFGQRWSIT